MIRVLIAEDHATLSGALAAVLAVERDIEVVGQVRDGKAALAATLAQRPDVVLTDIEMPEMTGFELAAELARQGAPARVIVLTTSSRPGFQRRALDANAAGYVLKDAPSDRLADAIRRVHAGDCTVDPELVDAPTEASPLTDRERHVLELSADGRSGSAIAAGLHLSEATVRANLSEAIRKLGASDRIEAVRRARLKGWL